MSMIDCFKGTSLELQFTEAVKGITDPSEQRRIGKELFSKTHEGLHNDLDALRKGINEKNPTALVNTPSYKPLGFSEKEKAIRNEYDDQIKEAKANTEKPAEPSIPTPPPPKNVEVGKSAGDQSGMRISKEGIFEQYGVKFEKTPLGWNERTQKEVGVLADDAERKGISVNDQAESVVNQMFDEASKGKLTVSNHRIVATALHLMNLDEGLDNLNAQTPETQLENDSRGVALNQMELKQQATLKLLDELGSLSGSNLGFFATMFSKNADGGITTYRNIISAANGIDTPETEKELDASKMSDKDKEKIRPYVQKLEKIKAEYEASIKQAKAAAPSPKSVAAKKARSQKVADKLVELAANVRKSDFFEKYNLAKPIKGATAGFTFDIQENLAKALEHIAEGIKKGAELVDLIKEAATKFKGNNDEADFTGLVNHVLKQNQDIDNFRFGRIEVDQDAIEAQRAWQQRRTLGQLRALAEHAKANNERWWKLSNDYRRNFLIGGLKTLARVGESGAIKLIIDPIANITTGNIVSLIPGFEKQRVSVSRAGEGLESLIKFKNDEEAKAFVAKKQIAFKMATEALDKDPINRNLQDARMKAELDYSKAAVYNFIHGNDWIDSMQLAKTGSTDFEEAMGGYAKVDYTLLRGQQKVLYVTGSLARLHGVEKNPSARRAFIESYNGHLENFQKDGVKLSASTRLRAMDMAYEDGFMPGKYQNKTQLSELVNCLKFAVDKPEMNTVEKAWSLFAGAALPVAKVPINIVKAGVDMSTLGIEGVIRYSANMSKNFYDLSKTSKLREAQGLEYNSIWQNLGDAARDIPAKDRAYIHNVLKKGLFGLGMYAFAAWGVNNGSIQYGGEYDDDHKGTARRRYKKPDGTWSEPGDLDYGQWVIFGHKFGKFASSVINHVPEFLPLALYVNTHNVYNYEHQYEGVTGDRATKGKVGSAWEATKSDINELAERLPFGNLLKPADFMMGLASIPLAADITEFFDRDKEWNFVQRKPTNVLEKMEMKAGLRFAVPKKEKE